MMKKLIGAIALLLLLFGGYKGYQYYDQTYNSQVAYAKVPEKVPPLKDARNDSGEKCGIGKRMTMNYPLLLRMAKQSNCLIRLLQKIQHR